MKLWKGIIPQGGRHAFGVMVQIDHIIHLSSNSIAMYLIDSHDITTRRLSSIVYSLSYGHTLTVLLLPCDCL